jgi:hypothetical protein
VKGQCFPSSPCPLLLLPLIPPSLVSCCPSSRDPLSTHTGRRGRVASRCPFSLTPCPLSRTRARGSLGVWMPFFPHPPAPSPARGRGGVWASGCFFLPACLLSPAAPHPATPFQPTWGEGGGWRPDALFPSPPCPLSRTRARGSLGVWMPFFPHPPCPLSRTRARGSLGVWMLFFTRLPPFSCCPSSPRPSSPAAPHPATPFQPTWGEGGGWRPDALFPSPPLPLKGRVLRSNARFAAFPRLLPLIPPTPFSPCGRRGEFGCPDA